MPWDFDVLNFKLLTNKFRIGLEFESSVYIFILALIVITRVHNIKREEKVLL